MTTTAKVFEFGLGTIPSVGCGVDEFLAAAEGRRGQYMGVVMVTNPAPAAAHRKAGVVLTKVTRAVGRTGIEYANLKVNEGRTDILPRGWSEWVVRPWIFRHKVKGTLYGVVFLNDGQVRAECFVDGVQVDRATFEGYLVPSDRNKPRPTGGILSPKLDNVLLLAGDA